MSHNKDRLKHLSIISSNVRGFQTNIGDLTHSFVIPQNADIVATVETFLNASVPENYGQISGYSQWYRRDRSTGNFGGIAVCFRKGLQAQPLSVDFPDQLELGFFRLWINTNEAILLCICYRPQWQGSEPVDYLHNNLDDLLHQFSCKHVIIVGDMNQHLVARPFEELLTVYGLCNHVDFPTHISGSSLDPVITDLPDDLISCCSLGTVGSSDHYVILTKIKIEITRDKAVTRTIWMWDKGDWLGFRKALEAVNWGSILSGEINEQVKALTNLITDLMYKYIPHKSYIVKPSDQPWFGYNCRVAAEAKSKAWIRYKNNQTRYNKELHLKACKEMKKVQKWAKNHWQRDLRQKLSGRSVGSKTWWNLVEQQQGFAPDDSIPPLNKADGSVAACGVEKAELLASFFAGKMKVPDPDRLPPAIPKQTNNRLATFTITEGEVKQLLLQVDVKKALGPDNISPHILKKCAYQLAAPLTSIFTTCLEQQTWPFLWKRARVVAVHKKKSRTAVENYRPISLLSVLGKIYEKIIVKRMTAFFEDNHLLSLKQFGFRKNRSTSDLLLQLTTKWNKSLDKGLCTYVVALDIAGAFDRVWHKGIIAKLKSLGINDNLLSLIQNYLQDRTLCVVVGGHTSKEYSIEASVPQGSVIGPLLWNVYFNDILHLIPEAYAYADDCTLTFTCNKENREATIKRINETLNLIVSWGKRWQVTLAPLKTQAMLISRKHESPDNNLPTIKLEGKVLPLQTSINMLGVQFDNHLTFTDHVKEIAAKCGRKLACIRRIAHLLDSNGCSVLYNSQVRSVMEYSPLVWSSCPPSHLRLLDRVQERARRLVEYKRQNVDPPIFFQPLQHRRDVSGLCVFFKVHKVRNAHLSSLCLPSAVMSNYNTRGSIDSRHELHVPFARTEQYLRSFHPRYSRLWNRFVRDINLDDLNTMQQFKTASHQWSLANNYII